MVGVNASTLRFWETEFDCISPTKTSKGERRYTRDDIAMLKHIRYLTHDRGFTLDGAREQLRKERRSRKDADDGERSRGELAEALVELKRMLEELSGQL